MNQQKILLIDYDPASIRRTATPLTKAGYQVEVAKDGVTGLAAFDEMHPDLVLVEAMLPKKHGFEVCQEIKAKADGSSTPVLITTAVCRGRKYRMDALQIYGCDEYIEKPIADAELVEMIGRFLSAASEAKEAVQEDLSAAIDAATPATPTSPTPTAAPQEPVAEAQSPDAIESMSDDEIEAKIDALLLGEDFADEPLAPEPQPSEESFSSDGFIVAEQPAAPPAQPEPMEAIKTAEPVETLEQQVEAIEPVETVDETDAVDDEMERRVAAMVEPAAAPAPTAEPQAELSAEPAVQEIAEMPAEMPVETPVETPEESPAAAPEGAATTPDEWTETAAETTPSGGSKKGLIAAAVVVLMLGATALFGWSQGWFGGGGESAASEGGLQAASAAPFGGPSLPAPIDEPTDTTPTPNESAEDEPVKLQPRTQPPSERLQRTSKPSEPIADTKPAQVTKPKPKKSGPSKAQIAAAVEREYEAEQQMVAAAGTLQSSLLAESAGESAPEIEVNSPAEELTLDTDQLLADAVPPPAREGDLVDIRSVDTLPKPIEFEQPAYDELAQRLRQEGTVIVEVLIDESGRVTDARVLQEIPRSRLNDAALRAARRWKYEPAQKDGVAVKVWKSERIIFKL